MFGKHLALFVIVVANVDYKVSSLPVESIDNLLTPDVLPYFNGVIGGGHFNLLDLDDTLSANRRLAKATDFDPATVVEVLEKLKNALSAAQVENEHDLDDIFSRRTTNKQSKNSKNSKNDNSKSKSSDTVNNKNVSLSNSSTGNNKTQSSKSSSLGNNKNQPSKSSSSVSDKNKSAQSNKNQSSNSNKNQSSKIVKNQSSKSNNNQSSQSDKNLSSQSGKNQTAQGNKTKSSKSGKNQPAQSNKNKSSQSNNNQSSQNNKNQSAQGNKTKSSKSGKNQPAQSNKNKSSQSNKNQSSQNNKNQSSNKDKNQPSKSSNSGNEKSQSKQTHQKPKNPTNGQVHKGSNNNGKGKPEKKGKDSKNNSKNPSKGGKKDKGKNNLPGDKKSSNKSNVLDLLDNKGFVKDLVNYTKKVMAEREFDLLVNTDLFLTIFKEDYEALAEVVEDNDDWEKYIKSALENFYLEVNKIYYNLVHVQSDNSSRTDQYDKAYDLAMLLFGTRKNFNAVKLAAPVRRIADLIKSIIGGPIEMIQTGCKKDMPIWQCNVAYISKLIAAAESCPNIWFHSLVLETMLEYNRVQTLSIGDPMKKILGHVKRNESPKNPTQAYKAFVYILKILLETKESAKKSLQLRAKLYQFITDLQNDGSLDCNNISTPLYVL